MGDDAVDFGGPGGSRRTGVRVAAVVAGGLVVAAVVAALVRFGDGSQGPAAGPRTDRSSSLGTTRSSEPSYSGSGPVVSHADLSWLRARADYSVIVRTDRDVQRFQPALGRLTRTTLPALRSTGPVYIAATEDHVFVHPIDFVPAYAVADDQRAREFHTAAGQGGAVLPGPDAHHVWVSGGRGARLLALVGLSGRPTSLRMRYPATGNLPVPDGRGYAVVQAVGGVYDVRPSGIQRGDCHAVVIDLKSGGRHVVPGLPVDRWPDGTGVISPDGHTAALDNGAVTLVDLDTGRPLAEPPLAAGPFSQTMAWSPDSRWLFVAAQGGDLRVIDTRDGRTRSITLFGAVNQVIVQSSG